ncbi:MAG: hypothetical protein ACK4VI_02035 [Alphaproteobacteria bacterium]
MADTKPLSLSEKFAKVNHWRHNLMDIAMISVVLGSVATMVTTGIPIGLLDPVGMFASMHIPSIDGIMALGSVFDGAVHAFDNGVLFTDALWTDPHAAMGHSAHAAHAGHAMHTAHAAAAASPQLSPEALELLGMN